MAAEHVQIYGLDVTDDALYAEYRRHMAPILARYQDPHDGDRRRHPRARAGLKRSA